MLLHPNIQYLLRSLSACLLSCLAVAIGNAQERVDYSRDVLPILSDNCYQCHGPDASAGREGDLRLDAEGDVRRDRDGHSVIVPEDVDASELYQRVSSLDDDVRMPPPELGRRLSAAQIEILGEWIRQGAPWGKHWAFELPRRAELDDTQAHPIDAMVEKQLQQVGLESNARASRETLIRRLSLDLTGLPPTPEAVDQFVADAQPEAWRRLIERTLASEAYGERMAWDWLEASRYADSNGYQGDNDRTMWPWRDWVVGAFNRNMPYDDFTVWQLAGDLLPGASDEQIMATGFCRNHMINGEGGRIPEENRVDYVMDMTETMSTVWLGLTLNCCRCHDHKFDPLLQREYYQLTAFFNQTPVDGGGGNPQTSPVLAYQDAKVMVMQEQAERRPTYILTRGLYNQPEGEVSPQVPASLPALDMVGAGTEGNHEHPTRLELASWLVSPTHPLTARVTVNRLWQMLFGIGLVKTTEDFGVQGEYPIQRELLDWLSVEFVESGWDVKHLLIVILTSETYQRSSAIRSPALYEADPANRYLARGPRFRMPSWMIRDQALAASGLLSRQAAGPPVRPYQPDGIWSEATFGKKTYEVGKGSDLYRRSLYTFWRRIVGPSIFFDAAKRQVCEVKPLRTNTPMHALTTLNDVTFVEAARALAARVLPLQDDRDRLQMLTKIVLARNASEEELALWERSLAKAQSHFVSNVEAAKELLAVGESPRSADFDPALYAAWTTLCLNMLNLDETLTKE